MILGLAVGWAVEAFIGLPGATVLGVFGGVLAANLVPLGPRCGAEPR